MDQFPNWVFHLFLVIVVIASCQGRLRHGKVSKTVQKKQLDVQCDRNNRYRLPDGQCNNLDHQTWGSISSPLDRLLGAAYDTQAGSPRTKASDGSDLPSSRLVSVKCHVSSEARADVTLMVMQWGQFLDHDIALTPASTEAGQSIGCTCGSSHNECFNIALENDEYFTSRKCLEFTRSHGEIVAGKREQVNIITAYIDASQVYGSSEEELSHLRGLGGEMLETDTDQYQDMLPKGEDTTCITKEGEYCFLAGDERVNEQPALAAMHTIFVRQNNRMASNFRRNTDWDDEKIFQETRKIVEAIMQRITYAEFLPSILSSNDMQKYGLGLDKHSYDPNVHPDISNAFATAAYRFGHSLIPEGLTLGTNLFEFKRGRDHGLPPYNQYRELCGLPKLTSLEQLFGGKPEALAVCKSIDDVDLFTGGMTEPAAPGALLGPTFSCILGRQFEKLKKGDRFFYISQNSDTGLNDDQIREINKMTLSKIICSNTENKNIQPNVFLPDDQDRIMTTLPMAMI